MKVYLGSKAAETAKFVDNFDKFFDCLNVDNFNSGHTKRKPFLEPYRAADDFRIKWLKDFLLYLDEWEKSVQARPGYDNKQKKQMILSAETLSKRKSKRQSNCIQLYPSSARIHRHYVLSIPCIQP